MLSRTSPARILVYLVAGVIAWGWLSGIGREHTHDAAEAHHQRQVDQVLAGHGAYASRVSALEASSRRLLASARQWRDSADAEGVARVDAENRYQSLLTAGDTLGALRQAERAFALARGQAQTFAHAFAACAYAADSLITALGMCQARNDTLTTFLAASNALLKQRRTWTLGFVTIPRPTKWQASVFGCLLGGLVDTKDRFRGCAAGGLGTVVLVPTR